MKKLTLALNLVLGVAAFAEVPALINYQGRLVDGVGNPVTGPKEFKLDIYDAQTEGTLIYQETLPNITLDEDGAYSFQFGAGESRTETSAVIATGDGSSAFFQYVLEQTPVGVISVTDGTNTFTSEDTPTGEESFSFTYTASLNRINLVSNEPPADGVNFTATFRYAESGIMGALGSASEHWMEVTIGDELQSPRQRLVAVPFALKAGVAKSVEVENVTRNLLSIGNDFGTFRATLPLTNTGFLVPDNTERIVELKARLRYEYIYPQAERWGRWIVYRVPRDHFEDAMFREKQVEDDLVEEIWRAEKLIETDLIIQEGDQVSFSEPDTQNLNNANIVISVTPKTPIIIEEGYQYVIQFKGNNANRDATPTTYMAVLEFLR